MSRKVVIDTSVVIKWLTREKEDRLQQADAILRDIQQRKISAYIPVLADYEVGNALLKGKGLSLLHAEQTLTLYYHLPLQRISLNAALAKQTYEFAHTYNLTYYDAAFVAAAYLLDAPLITDNPKHQSRPQNIKTIALTNYS